MRQSPRGEREMMPTFGPSGMAERFELLREESLEEYPHPAQDRRPVVASVERCFRSEEDFCRGVTVLDEVVEEKVVQLVRPYQLLGVLGDSSSSPDGSSSGLIGVATTSSRISRIASS